MRFRDRPRRRSGRSRRRRRRRGLRPPRGAGLARCRRLATRQRLDTGHAAGVARCGRCCRRSPRVALRSALWAKCSAGREGPNVRLRRRPRARHLFRSCDVRSDGRWREDEADLSAPHHPSDTSECKCRLAGLRRHVTEDPGPDTPTTPAAPYSAGRRAQSSVRLSWSDRTTGPATSTTDEQPRRSPRPIPSPTPRAVARAIVSASGV